MGIKRKSYKNKEVPKKRNIRVVAIRTRLYEIQDKLSLMVSNREGMKMYIKPGDAFWIGKYDSTIQVNDIKMKELVNVHKGFTFIEFIQPDGVKKAIYCMITKIRGDDVFLYDLVTGQVGNEIYCKLNDIQVLISEGVLYEKFLKKK